MILVVSIVFAVFIFPFLISINLLYNGNDKSVDIDIYLFKLIKLKNVYIYLENGKVFILTGKKKERVRLNDVFSIKKKIKPFSDYHIIKLYNLISVGSEDTTNILSTVFALDYFERIIKDILNENKPFLKTDTYYEVYDENKKLIIYSHAEILLNVLMIVFSAVKIFTEKLYYATRKLFKQNKRNNKKFA